MKLLLAACLALALWTMYQAATHTSIEGERVAVNWNSRPGGK